MNRTHAGLRASAFAVLCACAVAARTSEAASRYWVASSAGNWSDSANWSTATGGAGGASVPGPSDVAYFNSTRVGSCTIDADVSVLGVSILTGYTGTITQGSGRTITIGTTGWTQAAGTFQGGSSAITLNGILSLTNASFISTSSTLGIDGNWTIGSGGTFTHNSGTVICQATSNRTFGGNCTFNNLTFGGTGDRTWTVNNTLTVVGTLRFDTSGGAQKPTGGAIHAQGNIVVANDANYGATTNLTINGTGNQTMTGSASVASGNIPRIIIDKASGTLTISGMTRTENNWTYTRGTIAGSGAVAFMTGGDFTIAGTHTLPNVIIGNSSTSSRTLTISSGTTLTASQSLTFGSAPGSGNLSINSGRLRAQGNITTDDRVYIGSAVLEISGTANQTFHGTATVDSGRLPNVEINKTGGTLTFTGLVRTENNWTHTAGNVGGSGTVAFITGGGDITVSRAARLPNVIIGNRTTSSRSINIPHATMSADSVQNVVVRAIRASGHTLSGTVSLSGALTNAEGAVLKLMSGSTIVDSVLLGTGGAYSFPGVDAGNYTYQLVRAGYSLSISDPSPATISVSANTTQNVVAAAATATGFTLSGTVSLSGALTNTAGATLQLIHGNAIVGSLSLPSGGAYSFSGLWSGTYRYRLVRANHSFNITAPSSAQVTISANMTQNITATAASGFDLSGTVVLTGDLTSAAGVTLRLRRVTTGTPIVDSVALDAGGAYSFNGLVADGMYYYELLRSNHYHIVTTPATEVAGNLTFDSAITGTVTINYGTVSVHGNATYVSGSYTGSCVIRFAGAGSQVFHSEGDMNTGGLPRIMVNKPSGTLTISGYIRTHNDWIHTTGAVDGDGTVAFIVNSSDIIISGTSRLPNVVIGSRTTSTRSIDLSEGTIEVPGDLVLDGTDTGSVNINNGTLKALGDVTVVTDRYYYGSGVIKFAGTGNQVFHGEGHDMTTGSLPPIEIDKPSGTLTITGFLRTQTAWTHTAGDVDGDGTVAFITYVDMMLAGGIILPNVIFGNRTTTTRTINMSAGTMQVLGDLEFNCTSTHGLIINNGTISAMGDVTITTDHTYSGTARVRLTGDAVQMLDSGGTEKFALPVVIDKTAGKAFLAGPWVSMGTGCEMIVREGVLDISGKNLTVHGGTFAVEDGGTFILHGDETLHVYPLLEPGSTVVYTGDTGPYEIRTALGIYWNYHNLTIDGAGSFAPVYTLDVTGDLRVLQGGLSLGGTLTVGGDLKLEGGALTAGGHEIQLKGDWSKAAGATFSPGTGAVRLVGMDQSISGSNTFGHLAKVSPSTATVTFEAGSRQTVTGALTLKSVAVAPGLEADAYVRGGSYSGTNFGTEASFMVKNDGTDYYREAYIRFGVGGYSAITSAVITLYPNSIGEPHVQECRPVTGEWAETTITYANRPSVGGPFHSWTPVLDVPVDIDVTALAQASLAGNGKIDVCIRGVTTGSTAWCTYSSREAAEEAQRPKLVIVGTAAEQMLYLRSSVPGTQWEIDPQGDRDIAKVDVRDSKNVNATRIDAYSTPVTNSGNNTRWSFVEQSLTLTAPSGGTYQTGDPVGIAWLLTNLTGSVKIELWNADKTARVKEIATVPNGVTVQSYSWNAAAPASGTATQYHFKLIGAEGDVAWTSQPITVNPPYILVEHPDSGGMFIDATAIAFDWDSRGISGVMLEILSAGGSVLWSHGPVASPGPFTATPNLGIGPDEYEVCTLRVSGTDENGRLYSDVSNQPFTVWGVGSEGVRLLNVRGSRSPFLEKDRVTISWRAIEVTGTVRLEAYDGPSVAGSLLMTIATDLSPVVQGSTGWTLPAVAAEAEFWVKISDSEGTYDADWFGPIYVSPMTGLGEGDGCAVSGGDGAPAFSLAAAMMALMLARLRRRYPGRRAV